MRHLHSVVFLVVFLLASPVLAQKEYNHWFFGFNTHLDFTFNPPALDDIGMTESIEGSASICDPVSGGLLFYTDGITVWNRQHTPMLNGTGLFSDRSSTQAALIVPDPADSKLYYIFTVDQSGYLGPTRGLNYSIVDMRLNGGLGDVTRKNINLMITAAEKLTAVRLCEGSAYWIIGHGLNDNVFHAWFLDSKGLNTTSVQSAVGSPLGPDANAGIGWLSASPNGLMLASTVYLSDLVGMGNSLEVFQFNPVTGVVSSPLSTDAPFAAYGVSFSPDNTRLYVTTSNAVQQYTLTAWSQGAFTNSRVILSNGGMDGGALKLGQDGKIYVQHSSFLGVIANPNALGGACNYTPQAVPQPGGAQSYGLPNNIDARVEDVCGTILALIKTHPTLICEGVCVDFRDSSRYSPDTWEWSFPGGTPSSHNGRIPPTVCYATPGRYDVRLIVENESGRDTAIHQITVMECQKPEVGLWDRTICSKECIVFTDTSTTPGERRWTFDGGTPNSHIGKNPPPICFDTPGRHKVTLIASNTVGRDTAIAYVTVEACEPPVAIYEHDTSICNGGSVTFINNSTGETASYSWEFEGGNPSSSNLKVPPTVTYSVNGRYRVMLITWNDYGTDTAYSWVTVGDCEKPQAVLSDYMLCAGDCIDLRDSSLNDPTQWEWTTEGGDRTSFNVEHPGRVCYNTPGTYMLRLIVSNAFGADTLIRTVTVERRDGWATEKLVIGDPLPACESFDTSITFYAGCAASTFTNLRASLPFVFISQYSGSVPINDSVTIGVTIISNIPGTAEVQLLVTIDGRPVAIPITYSIVAAPENFVISRFDSSFTTAPCDPLDHELVIQNLSCADKQITEILLDPLSGQGFSLSGVQTPYDLKSDDSIIVTVTFDPGSGGPQTGMLIVRTADGSERRIPLNGSSPEITKARLSLSTTGSSTVIAGDVVRYSLLFEDALDVTHSPELIDLALNYNTDLLTVQTPQPESGWALDSYTEIDGKLTATLRRTQQAIASGEKLITLDFTSFLAKEDSTQLAISEIRCNPDDPQFERCVLLVVPGDSSTVTVGAECGAEEMRYMMGKSRPISMTVRPNPVTTTDGVVTIDLETRFISETPIPYHIDLVDMLGRSIRLHSANFSSMRESISLPVPTGMHGLCVLRLTSEHFAISTPVHIH